MDKHTTIALMAATIYASTSMHRERLGDDSIVEIAHDLYDAVEVEIKMRDEKAAAEQPF